MMKKSDDRVCFILNAQAQSGRAGKKIEWLKKEADRRWSDYDIYLTGKHGSAAELSRKDYKQYDVVVACGGDGTLHNAVNRALHDNIVVGLLPIGSGNDFAKAIDLPKNLEACLDIIKEGKTKQIDLLHCTGDAEKWCVNTLGMGLDGLANKHTTRYKKSTGNLSYFIGAVIAAVTFRGCRMEVAIDRENVSKEYLMITACNGQVEGGSFVVGPEAKLDDGLIDLLTITPTPVLKLLYYLPKFRWGIPDGLKTASSVKCRRVEIRSAVGLSAHGDGEHLGSDIHKLNIELHPDALEVIVPG